MATNYPTSKQTFTNPSAGDPTNSPSHAGLHADLADTVEAIQDVIGTGSGLTLSDTYVADSWTVLASAEPVDSSGFTSPGVTFNNSRFLGIQRESNGNQNSYGEWEVGPLRSGTWRLDVLHYKFTDAGIYTVSFDGSDVGTIDEYAGSGGAARSSITGITVSDSGRVTVRFTMATKNASSSNYKSRLSAFTLTRTGA